MTETIFLALIFVFAVAALILIDLYQRRNVLRIERPLEADRQYHFDQSLGLDEDPERKETPDGIQEKHSD